MAKWITPKTDWSANDRFNIDDFNRIKNNIDIAVGVVGSTYGNIDYVDMGADIEAYTDIFNYESFNAIEENVKSITSYIPNYSGIKQTFYPNGAFIKYNELNRIESAVKHFESDIEGWVNARMRIPMVLGRDRRTGF